MAEKSSSSNMQKIANQKLWCHISNILSINFRYPMQFNRVSKNPVYSPVDMAGRPPLTPPTECGERLASLRKAAGLSQAQLAEAVGIPQRTVSFYERKAEHLPSTLVPKLAQVLGVSIDVVLGISVNGSRRGPKSKIERQLEAVRDLPRSKQKFVSEFLDTVLQAQGDT